ncbi:MAG TPA: hypothetical protein VI168_10815 [Croceibacterium sp.]
MRVKVLLAATFIVAAPGQSLALDEAVRVLPEAIASQTEYARHMTSGLAHFGSEPLWTEGALEGFARRYRVTLTATSFIRGDDVQIRIDEQSDGSTLLVGKVYRNTVGIVEEVERRLTPEEYADFSALIDRSGLWSRLPESWVRPHDVYCAHGREVLLERRDASDYGLSEAEHCTTPAAMDAVIFKMLDLAQFTSRSGWMPGMWQ